MLDTPIFLPSKMRKIRIAISLGDPNGIGAEVVLKCLQADFLPEDVQPILVGSMDVLHIHARRVGFDTSRLRRLSQHLQTVSFRSSQTMFDVLDCANESLSVAFGSITEGAGRLSMRSVDAAIEMCLSGYADGIVTAPISKEAISMAGYQVPGHTEYLAQRFNTDHYLMMLVCGDLRVALMTTHIPLAKVPMFITEYEFLQKVRLISASLQRDFGIDNPRIAVLGLNPHAGDGGVLGSEEQNILMPAIQKARSYDFNVSDPQTPDGFWALSKWQEYDAVLAMYHDQGLIPFKMLAFDKGVNFTAGLPIIRTSPDHGTAFDIAGKNVADPQSMAYALQTCVDLTRQRLNGA